MNAFLLLAALMLPTLCHASVSDEPSTVLTQLADANPGMSFEVVDSVQTVFGTRQARVRVLCYGIPFYSFQLVAEQDASGAFTGRLNRDASELPSCAPVKFQKCCSVSDCTINNYVNDFLVLRSGTGRPMQKRFQRTKAVLMLDDAGTPQLMETVDVLFQNDLNAYRGFLVINACTGELVRTVNASARATVDSESSSRPRRDAESDVGDDEASMCVKGFANDASNQMCCTVKTLEKAGYCKMQNEVGLVRSANDGGCLNAPILNDNCQTPTNPEAVAVLSAIAKINTCFEEWYGIKAPVARPDLCVNFGSNFSNALYTGESLLFGDGRPDFSVPFTTLGTTVHEYAHIITELFSGLELAGASGGLSDAFSDASSRAIRRCSGVDDTWWEGAKLLDDYQQGIRSFSNPPQDGLSIDNLNDFYPEMDTHFSCGIFNKFLYSMVEDKNNSMRDVYWSIFGANKVWWQPTTDFVEAACGVLRSSVGAGVNTDDVRAAFSDRGINLDACSLSSVEQVITPENRIFRGVKVSQTSKPYFRIDANGVGSVVIRTNNNVNLAVTSTTPYGDPIVEGENGAVRVSVPEGSSKLYVRLESDADRVVIVRAVFRS